MLINTNGSATALRFLDFHGKVSLVSLGCTVLKLSFRDLHIQIKNRTLKPQMGVKTFWQNKKNIFASLIG